MFAARVNHGDGSFVHFCSTAAPITCVIEVQAVQIALLTMFNYANAGNHSPAVVYTATVSLAFAIYQGPAEIWGEVGVVEVREQEKEEKKKRHQSSSEFSSQGRAPVKPEEHDSEIAKMAS